MFGDDRGQTALDFVTGMVVFLLAVGFIVSFIPTMFEPFTGGDTSDTMVADRIGSHLVEERLADPSAQNRLDEEKVETFFVDNSDDIDADLLGVSDRTHVNVTIEDTTGPAERDIGGTTDLSLAAGPAPPDRNSAITSDRVVLVPADGGHERMTLYVRVW